jgi:hypothetical protein
MVRPVRTLLLLGALGVSSSFTSAALAAPPGPQAPLTSATPRALPQGAPRPDTAHPATTSPQGPGNGLRRTLSSLETHAHTAATVARFRMLDVRDQARVLRRAFGGKIAFAIDTAGHAVGARPDAAPEYQRAMFHFIDGRNNLESDAVKDVDQLVKGSVGDTRTVHVVEMATLEDPIAHRFKVYNGTKTDLGKVDGVDFGKADAAHDFYHWGLTAKDAQGKPVFGAKQYDFSMWDHGGAFGGDMFDDTTGNHIALSTYGRVFPETDKAGVHVADFCLGGNVEHMTEIAMGTRTGSPGAHIYVASEETEPGEGHDYIGVGKAFVANPNMDLRAQGKTWVHTYVSSYSNGSQGHERVQSAALDIDGVANLVPRLRIFSKELIQAADAGERGLLVQQAKATQGFAVPGQRDLYDFAKRVSATTGRPSLKAAAGELMSYLDTKVISYNEINPDNKQHANAHGLAIWLPTSDSERALERIQTAAITGHVPASYQGYRIASMPASFWQSVRGASSDYANTAFAKAAPEWVAFTKIMAKP